MEDAAALVLLMTSKMMDSTILGSVPRLNGAEFF